MSGVIGLLPGSKGARGGGRNGGKGGKEACRGFRVLRARALRGSEG